MSLNQGQFPTNNYNPFLALSKRLGGSKSKGLVDNQEHEGRQLRNAIVTGAVQHHFAMKAAGQQNAWAESTAKRQHTEHLETLGKASKLVQGGTDFQLKVGDTAISGTRKSPTVRQPATPVKPEAKQGLVEQGAGGRFQRKQS